MANQGGLANNSNPVRYNKASAFFLCQRDPKCLDFYNRWSFLSTPLEQIVDLELDHFIELGVEIKTQQELVDQLEAWSKERDSPGNLLVLGYSGHGGEYPDAHLKVTVGDATFDITTLQEYIRDKCQAHALTILACCHAGQRLGDLPANAQFTSGRIVETLAVGDGDIIAKSGTWVNRLSDQLEKGPVVQTVEEMHKAIYRAVDTDGPGFYNRELGEGTIVLEREPMAESSDEKEDE